MNYIGAHMEEEILEEGGAKEETKFIKKMIQIIVVTRIVVDQTTFKRDFPLRNQGN